LKQNANTNDEKSSEKEEGASSAAEVCSSIEHTHRPKEYREDHLFPGEHEGHRVIGAHRLRIVVALTGTMMVAEFIGGYLTDSIALTSDAGHMLTHFGALLTSLVAMKIAERATCQRRSFGLYRVEILAALANGVVLTGVAAIIFYSAFQRFFHPEPIKEVGMLIVASVGLVVNLVSVAILLPSSHASLNIRSAALHMLGDTLSSVGVVGAGIVMLKWKWYILDPIVAVVIGVVIFVWALSLMRECVAILLESAPKQIDIEQVAAAVKDVQGVLGIHDIHVWEITTRMYAMCAHVKVADIKLSESEIILARICDILNRRFDITHASIQFER
jgi:cobalt-zinc-cadmium efflux system protein